ncbi:hypothetical protein [Thiococcus pfennigii]|jgi:hypothetical protein|uniref:hypothetical protein n=1 Tax=Thiococcus pfennigii TaxID=1057 RepID=UPI0019078116|nr:hypothetical protein [Thiococcus pfennigii]MBK1702853.1 hypothetical protein [Thiococcus pfennigii]MBK1733572.1 hypothetical protein [Thiococcus pfennigii]
MASHGIGETFFRPDEHDRAATELPAPLINGLRRLLARAERPYLFLPIRAIQYLAVVEPDEVFFVDGQGGYAHRDGIGGRLIRIAWRPQPAGARRSLSAPVPSEILYYAPDLEPVQRRLVGEVGALVARHLAQGRPPPSDGRILPFRR